ncbi:MAG TPA: alanine--tRNA ligase, partial [Desulfitobacterium dehalogenans]|nr:alanine--tRNA ligase [Desulfitobacterium dehalogenans]
MRSLNDQILDASQLLKAQPSDLTKRIQGLLVQVKDLEKEVQQLHAKVAKSEVESLLEQVKDIHGVPVLAAKVSAQDMDALRNTADLLKDKMKTGVLVLGAAVEGKVNWVTVVTPTGLSGLHAGQIIKEVAKITGGGGGGRPDMAQAGGKDAAKLGEALDQVPAIIKSYLK